MRINLATILFPQFKPRSLGHAFTLVRYMIFVLKKTIKNVRKIKKITFQNLQNNRVTMKKKKSARLY